MFPAFVLKEVRYTCISTSCASNQMKMHTPLVIKRECYISAFSSSVYSFQISERSLKSNFCLVFSEFPIRLYCIEVPVPI